MSDDSYKFTIESSRVTQVIRIDEKGREKLRSLNEPNKQYVANSDGTVSIVETYASFTETKVYGDADANGVYILSSKFKTFADGTMLIDDSGRGAGQGADDGPGDDRGSTFTRIGTDGDDILRGVARSESIAGAGGDDRLDGRGGRDTLEGGAGRDVFVLSKKAGAAHRARIEDFSSDDDQIELDDKLFKGVTASNLDDSLVFGDRALEADDRLILKQIDIGFELYYDRDGSGGKEAVLIATVIGTVDAGDITVV
jgi:Ca2+-binding RTX toxin-like protein